MPAPELEGRIANLVGGAVSSFERVHGGYTPADRWTFKAGRQSYFAKVATTDITRKMLRQEIVAYDKIRGSFMPERIAAEDHETSPILILEDLSGYSWPPPWRDGQIKAVLAQVDAIHNETPDLPTFEHLNGGQLISWPTVAENKQLFLSLGVASEAWLDRALPALIEAEANCVTEGSALTHWDIRSDNICIQGQSVKLIDWNNACLANPKFDLGAWLPSLEVEGGPPPESILGHEPEIAACICGYFAARAGLPNIMDAPRVRHIQRQQLGPSLAWVTRALKLPEPS